MSTKYASYYEANGNYAAMSNLGGAGYNYGLGNLPFQSSQSDSSSLPLNSSDTYAGFPSHQRVSAHQPPFISQESPVMREEPGLSEATHSPSFPMAYSNPLLATAGIQQGQGFSGPEAFQQMLSLQQMVAVGRHSGSQNLSPNIVFNQQQSYSKHAPAPYSIGPSSAAPQLSTSVTASFNMSPRAVFAASETSFGSSSTPVLGTEVPHSIGVHLYNTSTSQPASSGASQFPACTESSTLIPQSSVIHSQNIARTLSSTLSPIPRDKAQPLNIPAMSHHSSQPQAGPDQHISSALSESSVPSYSSSSGSSQKQAYDSGVSYFNPLNVNRRVKNESNSVDTGQKEIDSFPSVYQDYPCTASQKEHLKSQKPEILVGLPQTRSASSTAGDYSKSELKPPSALEAIISSNNQTGADTTTSVVESKFQDVSSSRKSVLNTIETYDQSFHTPGKCRDKGSSTFSGSEPEIGKRSKVQFLVLGKLSKKQTKLATDLRRAILEATDSEDINLSENIIGFPFSNLPVTSSTIKSLELCDDRLQELDTPHKIKTEQPKAGIIKEALRSCTPNRTPSDSSVRELKQDSSVSRKDDYSGPDQTEDDENTDVDGEETEVEPTPRSKPLKYQDNTSTAENLNDEEEGGDLNYDNSDVQESWFGAGVYRQYGNEDDFRTEDAKGDLNSPRRGKRNDPAHPFAITSPSFNDSAARAVMTTTAIADATIVTISIMSIGNKDKLIPKIINSRAAAGGIVSLVNLEESRRFQQPDEDTDLDQLDESLETEVKSDQTSIMSKLKRSKKEREEELEEPEVGRVDVNIRINDSQYVSVGGELKRWQCSLCLKSYTTKHNLVAHILDHSGIKPHLCLLCGKYFKQLSHLNTHMLTHDNVKPHVCHLCNKGFTQISHLKRHQAVHLDSKPYICDVCNRGFAYPSELRLHKDKHIPGKDKCLECGEEFGTAKELRDHMLTHENRNDLTCKHCNRVFRFPSQLKDHMITHAGARPFICTECGMDFMKDHHLKAHQFTHTGLRPYSCPHCSRSFNQKANMVRHMLIHNSDRAYKCDSCDKTFTQPQTLKAHMVVHADQKPYSCKYCGKQFGRLHNLQGHMHMHNNSKPYVCFCGSSFTLKGNLNRHKKVKHGLNESTESMEEDAVNFLSSLSERVRDTDSKDEDMDPDVLKEDTPSQEWKSLRKGRKSTPRKMVHRKDKDEELTGENEENSEDDGETEESNESVVSSYFATAEEQGKSQPRRKRKRDVCYRVAEVEDSFEEQLDDNYEPGKPLENCDRANDADGEDNDTEVDTGVRQENRVTADGQRAKPPETGAERRSTRKRRKREPRMDDDFDYSESVDDIDEDESIKVTTKSRRKTTKGANLDSLIASKFKTM